MSSGKETSIFVDLIFPNLAKHFLYVRTFRWKFLEYCHYTIETLQSINMISILITPKLIAIMDWAIRYAYFLKVIPYSWDDSEGEFQAKQGSKVSTIMWYCVAVIYPLHQIYILTRLMDCIVNKLYSFSFTLLLITYVLAFFIPSIFQVMILFKKNELLNFIIHYLNYFKHMQNKYQQKPELVSSNPSWTRECELMLGICFALGLTNPFMMLVIYFINPTGPLYLTTMFAAKTQSFWEIIIFSFPTLWVISGGWATLVVGICLVGPFFYMSTFLTQEIRYKQYSLYTKPSLRVPAPAIHTYKCLQILDSEFNDISRDTLFIFINNVVILLAVITNIALIRFHSHLNFMYSVVLLSMTIFCSLYLIIIYIKLGNYQEVCKTYINSWRRNPRLNRWDRNLILKYVNSFRVLEIKIGSFGSFKKEGCIRIIGKLIYCTTKSLMILKRY